MAKEGSSAKFCVYSTGGPLAKRFICQVLCSGIQGISSGTGVSIGQSRFICQVLCVFHWYLGCSKVGSSAKFCVVVYKSSLLWYWGVIGQRRIICQVLCSGMQVISATGTGGSISQSRFICQVLCSGIQVISALVLGGHWPKKVHLPSLV